MSGLRRVDGNALGGVLSEVFAVDLTMATTTCAGCRGVAPLAILHVYLDAPGAVARCPTCDAVQLRIVRSEARIWLDLTGIRGPRDPKRTLTWTFLARLSPRRIPIQRQRSGDLDVLQDDGDDQGFVDLVVGLVAAVGRVGMMSRDTSRWPQL